MSTYEAQGQTMDEVLISLEKPSFNRSLFYVDPNRILKSTDKKAFFKRNVFQKKTKRNIANCDVL